MERFLLPENLAELGGDDLANLETQANTRLAALREVSSPSQDDINELAAIKAFRSHHKAFKAANAEFAAGLAELGDETPEPTPEPEPVPAPEPQPEPDPAPEPENPPVTAATRPVPSVAIPEAPARPALVITASADIPQVPLGAHLDLDGLSQAVINKARAIGNSTQRHPIATIQKQFADGYDVRGLNNYKVMEVLNELASISSFEAAMTAAGGWCAPNEILYDLYETICPNPSLFTLPTFRANRGGVTWPVFEPIDFTRVVDWVWTEEDDIAATGTKPCIRLGCPEFTECRLDAYGVCVEIGNFQDRAYPEAVRWDLNRVYYLHDRVDSLRKINAVIADSDSATIAATFGAASALVAALLLQVQAYRDRNGLCQNAMVEAVAPAWLAEAIRADIARQDFGGVGNAGLVTDGTIRGWFADSGVSIRFLDFWQALTTAAPGPLVWPEEVDILFYTPGSYVQFDGGTLDLGITRDSVLNSTNDFNIFTEDFYCIGRRGPRGVLVTVPIAPTGEVGGRNPSATEVVAPLA